MSHTYTRSKQQAESIANLLIGMLNGEVECDLHAIINFASMWNNISGTFEMSQREETRLERKELVHLKKKYEESLNKQKQLERRQDTLAKELSIKAEALEKAKQEFEIAHRAYRTCVDPKVTYGVSQAKTNYDHQSTKYHNLVSDMESDLEKIKQLDQKIQDMLKSKKLLSDFAETKPQEPQEPQESQETQETQKTELEEES